MFLNLAVTDLEESTNFFKKLGFEFDPQFTDENGTCMIIGENAFVMLLVKRFFRTFIKKEIVDSQKFTESIIALALNSKEEVDIMISSAVKAGAKKYKPAEDMEFMYGWGFEDLDGHLWEVFYMDKEAMASRTKN
jgi:predicted lactoylglutathione lyase